MRRSPWRPAGAAAWWPAGAAAPAVLALVALTGCALTGCSASGAAKPVAASSAAQSPMPAATGQKCGTGKTAAGVPVTVEVGQGAVGCPTAMKIEHAYAAALASGHAPGNGGGGPVSVKGWVCVGFDTPQILRTGDASKCSKGPSEILAVLAMPAGSARVSLSLTDAQPDWILTRCVVLSPAGAAQPDRERPPVTSGHHGASTAAGCGGPVRRDAGKRGSLPGSAAGPTVSVSVSMTTWFRPAFLAW